MPSEMRFSQVQGLLEAKGYQLVRVRGSHHVFAKPGSRPLVIPVHHGKVKYAYVRKIESLE
jgi:predicted RNA binding protein YcfA (HicA-like mRNA interferase family)